ncbi:hypothetical protein Y1Q_0020170 [Alligator mississippiensis]|nr:hypothetical protein Y1Q_0020170 [Alligator mississippiensis]
MERAVDATIKVFKRINRRDLAAKLQEEKDTAPGHGQSCGRSGKGYREMYTEQLQIHKRQELSSWEQKKRSSIYLLCEALKDPQCKVKKIWLQECHLTDTCGGDLADTLSTSLNLAELDLTGNSGLGAGGVQLLCEGLRHPSCKLQTLRLWGCDLTDACCGDLATALGTSPNLTELDLSFVTGLGAGSMQLLLWGLRHPCCKLQTLRRGARGVL